MRPINTRALPVVILAVPEVSVAVGPTITPVGISANSPCLITPVREYVKERSSARRSRTQAVTRRGGRGPRFACGRRVGSRRHLLGWCSPLPYNVNSVRAIVAGPQRRGLSLAAGRSLLGPPCVRTLRRAGADRSFGNRDLTGAALALHGGRR